jgi:hypothetical protein
MRGTQLAVLLLVLLLVVPQPALGAVRGSPDIEATASDNRVIAGEQTEFTVTLVNKGDLDTGSNENPSLNDEVMNARGVEVTLNPGEAPVDVRTGTRVLGQLPKGETAGLGYQLSVAEDAEPGTYEMEVEVKYTHTSVIAETDGVRNERTRTRTFDVEVEVVERARFEVTDVESDVRVGETGNLDVTLQNTGTEAATDTRVDLESPNADLTFTGSQTASREAGTLDPGEERTLSYRLKASEEAKNQAYTFSATSRFQDGDGVSRESDALTFGVSPAPEMEFELGNVTSDLQVGKERSMRGEITNHGDSTARDVVVQLTSENEKVDPADREYSVGSLAPGATAAFEYDIEISDSANAVPRQFTFVAEYRTDDGDVRTSDELASRQSVAPETDRFGVTVQEGTVQNGQRATLALDVTNNGAEPVSEVSAKLFADDPISAEDSEAYISSLDPGETKTIEFAISSSGAMPKEYPVKVDFDYQDADGDNARSKTYRRPVDVQESEDGGSNLPLILAGLSAAAVAGFAYMRLR